MKFQRKPLEFWTSWMLLAKCASMRSPQLRRAARAYITIHHYTDIQIQIHILRVDYTDTDTSLYITPAFFEWANNRAPKTTTTKVKWGNLPVLPLLGSSRCQATKMPAPADKSTTSIVTKVINVAMPSQTSTQPKITSQLSANNQQARRLLIRTRKNSIHVTYQFYILPDWTTDWMSQCW